MEVEAKIVRCTEPNGVGVIIDFGREWGTVYGGVYDTEQEAVGNADLFAEKHNCRLDWSKEELCGHMEWGRLILDS